MGSFGGLRHMISITEGAQGGPVNTPSVPREPVELVLGVRSFSMTHGLKFLLPVTPKIVVRYA